VSELPWRIECGDGPNGLLAYGPVDMVFADVPYGKHVDENNAAEMLRNNPFDFEPMTSELMERIAKSIAARCRRWAPIMTSCEETHLWRAAMTAAGMEYVREGQWIRQNTKPQMSGDRPAQGSEPILLFHSRLTEKRWNGGGKPAIWYAPIVRGDAKLHPTQKPAALMRQLIEDFSDPLEIVADPTAGSFETGVCAIGLGRRFVGWDLQQKYVDIGRERMSSPLFDARPMQSNLFGPSASTHATRAREQLDHAVLRLIPVDGVARGQLLDTLGVAAQELTRALGRLRKAQLIRCEGKTNGSKYFRITRSDADAEISTGNEQP
jgi:hypothetical protein